MIGRRGLIASTLLGALVLAAPAAACRAPRAKDRRGYRAVADALFAAWWARDYPAFQRSFEHPDVPDPFDGRALFDAHFETPQRRFQGALMFNGSSLVTQIVTPREADPEHGICGGYASADLFLLNFFAGPEIAVLERVDHVDSGVLAETELNEIRRERG